MSRKLFLFFCLVLLLNSGLFSFFSQYSILTMTLPLRHVYWSRVYFCLQLLSATRSSQLPKLFLTLLCEFSLSFKLLIGERQGDRQSSSRKLEKDFAYDARKKRWSLIRTEDFVRGSLKLCYLLLCRFVACLLLCSIQRSVSLKM